MTDAQAKQSLPAPEPVPFMVTRTSPAWWNADAREMMPASEWQEQNGWEVKAERITAWSMDPAKAIELWRDMIAARAA